MIEFKKLLTIPYNKGIYIDCTILDMPYFKDVYLDKIVIDTQDTFNSGGPSDTPIYSITIEGEKKGTQITIKDTDLLVSNMEGTMFFVYVYTKGTPSSDIPCGLDNNPTLGVTVDAYPIYKKALNFLNGLYNNCDISKNFIDFILRYKAFQICLKTRDYPLAITYWNKFIKSISTKSSNGCGCNG